ncbi:MAG TPA: nitrate reductase molybdenum cofactor assembly chaperone [Burkholderiales bacterium]|nr:nitrate reductase molybdenum cofactor assembly chaperone [Burkholderiales bacterium]
MNRTLKAIAALLEYPDAELVGALDEIEQVLAEDRAIAADFDAISALISRLRDADLLDAQEAFVELFDRGRSTSLNLFEHVHGESRDRGQAMVDLRELYASRGLMLDTNQLPDYLPVYLEFLATCAQDEVREKLGDISHILQVIGATLSKRYSSYAALIVALLRIAGERRPEKLLMDTTVTDDTSPEALDRTWIEEPVTFLGGGAQPGQDQSVIHFYPKRPSREADNTNEA